MYNRADRVKALQYASIKIRENIMKNKITDLVGKKVKCIKGLRGVTQNRVYEVIKISKDYQNFLVIVGDNGSEISWNSKHFEEHFEIMEETQFKQGDKVLVSNDEVHWNEAKYALFFDNNHFTYSSQGNLIKWKHIKPYEEEIKVGDWVFLNDEKGVCKITEKHDLKEVNNSFTLLKNKKLIELLNNEL